MMLDTLIYKIAIATLILSALQRQALLAAALLIFSFAINELTFVAHPTWTELENRYTAIAMVNFFIMITLMSRLKTPELALGLAFGACSLYHQWMLIEIQNHVLGLKHLRSDFMTVITAVQLSTVIYILVNGSQANGGRRVKRYLHAANHRVNSIFHIPAQANSK